MKFLINISLLSLFCFAYKVKGENFIRINGEFRQSYKCLMASDRYVYIATDLGLFKFNGQNLNKIIGINTSVYDLYEDEYKSIWIIDSNGDIFCKKVKETDFIKVHSDFGSRFIFGKIVFESGVNLYVRVNKKTNNGIIFDSFACINKTNQKSRLQKGFISGNTKIFTHQNFTFQTFYHRKTIYTNWLENRILILDSSTNEVIKEIGFGKKQINDISILNNKLVIVFDHGIYSLNDTVFTFNEIYKIDHPTCVTGDNNELYVSSLAGFYKSANKYYKHFGWSQDKFLTSCYFVNDNDFYYSDKNYNLFHYAKANHGILVKNTINRFSYYNNLFYFDDYINFNKSIYSLKRKKILNSSEFIILFDTIHVNQQVKFLGSGYLHSFLSDHKLQHKRTILYGEKINDIKRSGELIVIASNRGIFFNTYLNVEKIKEEESDYYKHYRRLLNEKIILDLEGTENNELGVLSENNEFYIFNNGKLKLKFELTNNRNFVFTQVKYFNDSTFVFSCKNGLLVMRYLQRNNEGPMLGKIAFYPLIFKNIETSFINNISLCKGKIFVSTSEGLYLFNLNDKSVEVKVELKVINLINNVKRSFTLREGIINEMDVQTNALILKYDIINYHYLPGVEKQIRYRLIENKHDTSIWQFASSDLISLMSLRKGQYKLQIEYLNNKLEWELINEYVFLIPKYFFETQWFAIILIIIAFLIIFITIYFTIDYRRKVLQNENYKLINENYELKFLKTQMNPHFVFNSLNSLKSLVFLNENSRAQSYIDNLAVFFRSVLDNTEKPEIQLDEELKNCQSYIELENIRLNNSIKLSLNIEAGCLKISIPSNIIQPIIENSIKHGFDFEQNKLDILIRLKTKENHYILEIIDSGRGLKKQIYNQKSFALKSIKKRLDRFNRNMIENSLLVENMYDGDSKVCGVICILKLTKKNEIINSRG